MKLLIPAAALCLVLSAWAGYAWQTRDDLLSIPKQRQTVYSMNANAKERGFR